MTTQQVHLFNGFYLLVFVVVAVAEVEVWLVTGRVIWIALGTLTATGDAVLPST